MLTQHDLMQILTYSLDSGQFFWAADVGNRRVGQPAGYLKKSGYVVIQVSGRSYFAHRLAWLYVMGEWPAGQVDHKNRNRSDNAWLNLRLATQSSNNANSGYRGSLGYRGVTYHKGKARYRATIKCAGIRRHLGWFKSPEEAASAYDVAAKNFHGNFATLNFTEK